MRPFHLAAIAAALLIGCAQPQPRPTSTWFGEETDQSFGRGEPTPYRLGYLLRMEKDRKLNQEILVDLELSAWDDGGNRRFVLDRQARPSHTLFTYSSGFLGSGDDFVVAVKSVLTVEGEEDWDRGVAHGESAVERWKERYPDLLETLNWEFDPKILFRFTADPRGRLGFYRQGDGSVPLSPDGTFETRSVHNTIEIEYRWFDPEKPDTVDNPKIFEALLQALRAFDTSPFPRGKPTRLPHAPEEGWEVQTHHAIGAVLEPAVTINKFIRLAVGSWNETPLSFRYRAEPAGEGRTRIVGERTEFGEEGEIGKGYQLRLYRREALYDATLGRFHHDRIRIEADQGDDRIVMELALEAR